MEKPQECHLIAVKRVMRYIKGTMDHGMLMPMHNINNKIAEVCEYIDYDFSGDQYE